MLLYIIHLWEKFAVKINVSDQNPKVVSVLYTKKNSSSRKPVMS